jgi:hypothetical protein
MPFIRCTNTSCSYRIQLPQPTPVCPNCGKPFTAPGSGSSAKPVPVPIPTSYAPVPVPPVPPVPMPSGSTVPTSPGSALGPLPPGMPSRVPDLEGEIALPPTNGPQLIPLDWSQKILKGLFFPFYMRKIAKTGSLPKPTMTVHQWQIARAADKATYEARVEGDLAGGQPRLSQKVSLWGRYRGGVLIVNRGYNHDTSAEILVHRPVAVWLSRVAVVALPLLILAVFVLFPGLIQSAISTIGGLIIIGIIFYVVMGFMAPWMPKRILNFLVLAFLLYIVASVFLHGFGGSPPH